MAHNSVSFLWRRFLDHFTYALLLFASWVLMIIFSIPIILIKLTLWIRVSWISRRASSEGLQQLASMDRVFGQSPKTVVYVLLFVRNAIDIQNLREAVAIRAIHAKDENGRLKFPRFSQIIVSRSGYFWWKDVDQIDLDYHVKEYKGPKPKSQLDLQRLLSEFAPLQRERPLWEFVLVKLDETFSDGDEKGECCIVFKYSHALADGISMMLSLLEMNPDNNLDFLPTLSQIHGNQTVISKIWKTLQSVVVFPFACLSIVFVHDRNVIHGAKLSGSHCYSYTSINLATLKALKNKANVTINDVLMACVGGALRRFIIHCGHDVPHTVNDSMPFGLFSFSPREKMNNSLSFAMVPLDLDISNPIERLTATKATLDELKHSAMIQTNGLIINYAIHNFPNSWMRYFFDIRLPASLGTSNIPGPQFPLHVLGSQLQKGCVFLPNLADIGLNIIFFSYNGSITMGVVADKALMKTEEDSNRLITFFIDELNEQLLAYGVQNV